MNESTQCVIITMRIVQDCSSIITNVPLFTLVLEGVSAYVPEAFVNLGMDWTMGVYEHEKMTQCTPNGAYKQPPGYWEPL